MLKRSSYGFHGTLSCLRSFKSFILYSTSVASKDGFMVDFLVKSVGFSQEEALAIVTKVRYPFVSKKRPELVVDYLKRIGFNGAQIRKVVVTVPDVLRNNVDKTLEPKIRVFQDIGFSGSDLGLFISRHPALLRQSAKGHIAPAVGMWKSLVGSNEELVRIMLQIKSRRLLYTRVLVNVPANIQLLQSYGVPIDRIKWLMVEEGCLCCSTRWFEKIVKGVEEKLGIPRTSAMFTYGISAMTKRSEEKILSWRNLFRTYGWSETEISELIRKHPLSLSLSEKSLRVKLKYFMEDLGYGSDYLLTYTPLLSYSMEKRILPRTAILQTLKERNLLKRRISVYSFISMAESRFVEKHLIPYKDSLPELYEYYTQVTGCTLSKR